MLKYILAVIVLLSTTTIVRAQQETGSIQGKVVDCPRGDPLPGVLLILDSNIEIKAFSDNRGMFDFKDVPTGEHEIKPELESFSGVSEKVIVHSAARTNINIEMISGWISQQVVLGGPYGTVSGYIVDQFGSPVPFVNINNKDSCSSTDGGFAAYVAIGKPATLTFKKKGFSNITLRNLIVTKEQPERKLRLVMKRKI